MSFDPADAFYLSEIAAVVVLIVLGVVLWRAVRGLMRRLRH